MLADRIKEASALASRIGQTIKCRCSAQLSRLDANTDAKDTWQQVRQLTRRSQSCSIVPDNITAQSLNDHYASVSTDESHIPSSLKHTCSSPPTTDISEIEVFRILDHLHHTSTGLDNIPAWFLRLGAALFSRPLAYLFSRSISTATVPCQWKRAFNVPIA